MGSPLRAEVFILTMDPRTEGQKSFMQMYGHSPLGPVEIICPFEPYFFVETQPPFPDAEPRYKSLSGVELKKVSFATINAAIDERQNYLSKSIRVFESEVKPRERFLMDRRINGGLVVEGNAEKRASILRFFNPTITPTRVQPHFSICSLDIETSVRTQQVISIGLQITKDREHQGVVFMQGGKTASRVPVGFTLTMLPDERSLFKAFLSWFQEADPDIVIGWNVIGFDLSYLKKRADILRLPLNIGRDWKAPYINDTNGRFSHARVPGRVVLDGPQVLRNSFYNFESYSLENVSKSVLGEGKLIGPSDDKVWEIDRLSREDPVTLAEYNFKDCDLVTKIFNQLGLLELTVRRTELSGMLLDQVGLSAAAFDHFYLPRLHDEGFVAPDVGDIGEVQGAAGGHVISPVAGIYENILALDFQSLYPSIIQTFKIDPLARACVTEDPLSTPAGFTFSRSRHILPAFIAELLAARRQAKTDKNSALSQAIKILMNSFYGVMGSSGSRLYHPDLPEAITSTGQWLLVETKHWIERQGHLVLYGDTDSLFLKLNEDAIAARGSHEPLGRALVKEINAYWQERLLEEFKLTSYLNLDYKKHYRKFLLPSARSGSENGAKKRYAGLLDENGKEEVEFVGLEVVRSDWTKLAQSFQRELYTRIFRGEKIEQWVRQFVSDLKAGKFDALLVYRKRLHKPVSEYGKSPPPYVRAAQKLSKPSRSVRYVMTLAGPVPIELNPQNPDYAHYIDKQLRPVADSILEVMGNSFEQIISAQLKLL